MLNTSAAIVMSKGMSKGIPFMRVAFVHLLAIILFLEILFKNELSKKKLSSKNIPVKNWIHSQHLKNGHLFRVLQNLNLKNFNKAFHLAGLFARNKEKF